MTVPLLAIDTSGARLQLGLLHDSGVETAVEARERGHAEILFDRIATLLDAAGVAYSDLGRIAVITGPGSFSGLRIGLSAARGLGLALDIPVIGISTLEAVSLSAPSGHPFVVMMDARRGEMYRQEFVEPGSSMQDEIELLPVDQAMRHLHPAGDDGKRVVKFTRVIGSGAEAAAAATGADNLDILRPEADRGFADIAALARFAASRDPARCPPVPAYVRAADAKPQTKGRIARVEANP